jgi:hypothetical protein
MPLAACGRSAALPTVATTTGSATTAGSAGATALPTCARISQPPDSPYRGSETLNVRYYAHLDTINQRQSVVVPPGIGFVIQDRHATGITSRHTHDPSGIIHIESQTNALFLRGRVFAEWGIRLTTGQVGGLMSGNGNVART